MILPSEKIQLLQDMFSFTRGFHAVGFIQCWGCRCGMVKRQTPLQATSANSSEVSSWTSQADYDSSVLT